MIFTDLKASLKEPKKVYLLEGEDSFFRSSGETLLKKTFLTEPDFNLSNFDGSSLKANVEQFVSALDMCPFLGDYRVICIDEWYPTATDFKNKELSKFFNSPLQTTIVIVNNKNKCDALKKQSAVEFVDCKKGDLSLITRYLQNIASKDKLIISKSNCELIAEFCLNDMSKISVEIAKLCSFCLEKGEISSDDINLLVTKETDYKIYEVVNFIACKNNDKAYACLKEMIQNGSEQVLLVSLYYHFRRLLLVSITNKSQAELASIFGVKEFAVKKSIEQARMFTPKRLMNICQKLISFDSDFKSGKISLEQAIENAVFMILTDK